MFTSRNIIILFIVALLVLVGCTSEQFACPDGNVVKNPSLCGIDDEPQEDTQDEPSEEYQPTPQDEELTTDDEPQEESEPVTQEYLDELIEQGKQDAFDELCNEECTSYKCEGMIYFDCVKGADSCNQYVEIGLKKGTCGVECI